MTTDDISVGMLVTILRAKDNEPTGYNDDPWRVMFGGGRPSGHIAEGKLFKVVAISLPFVALEPIIHSSREDPRVWRVDTRRVELMKITEDYANAGRPDATTDRPRS